MAFSPIGGPPPSGVSASGRISLYWRLATVLGLLFIFLVGIKGLGTGFKLLGQDIIGAFFMATENPFVGLTVGILATTLVQSSSVTTSMIVGLCAAPEDPLPIANAVPMIMGANIGTTVTNSLASLAHMTRREEFIRAFSVATCHDFFNLLSVALLLPLEMTTGLLSRVAGAAATAIASLGGVTYQSPLKSALSWALAPVKSLAHALFDGELGQAILILLVSGGIIVGSLILVVRVMRVMMRNRVENSINRVLGRRALLAMLVGIVATIMVQSSSITTALLVPLAGAGLISLRQAFPITLGANLGTTVTALLASLAAAGGNVQFGIQIGLVHLLFNLLGIALIYPLRPIRNLPLRAAEGLAQIAARSRRWAVVYVLGLFYGVPAGCIFLSRLFG